VDEFFVGRRVKILTVVSDLVRGEPIWAGPERKRETLDRFFAEALLERSVEAPPGEGRPRRAALC
jgi:transposase